MVSIYSWLSTKHSDKFSLRCMTVGDGGVLTPSPCICDCCFTCQRLALCPLGLIVYRYGMIVPAFRCSSYTHFVVISFAGEGSLYALTPSTSESCQPWLLVIFYP